MWSWITSFFGSSDSSSSGTGNTIFAYVLLGIVAILLIAVVFGELEGTV